MTDMPRVGMFCVGKSPLELADSIYCSTKVSKVLKDYGFALGGYRTSLLSNEPKIREYTKERLYNLCLCNDLILTFGGEGFSYEDNLPEITGELCESRADFFSFFLCGASIYAGEYFSKEKKSKSVADSASSLLPSRGRSGICEGCLILNFRSNVEFVNSTLNFLLPQIELVISNLCKKSALSAKSFNEKLYSVIKSRTGFVCDGNV